MVSIVQVRHICKLYSSSCCCSDIFRTLLNLFGFPAAVTGLTELHLGGLIEGQPSGLSLPSVQRLTVHLRPPRDAEFEWWLEDCAPALEMLAAFPGLTGLELTGAIFGATLEGLPSVVPKKLQELLLPLCAVRMDQQCLEAVKVSTRAPASDFLLVG